MEYYSTGLLDCGFKGPSRIVGGTTASKGSWPWQIVMEIWIDGQSFMCGGTLLTSSCILTAAHCVDGA